MKVFKLLFSPLVLVGRIMRDASEKLIELPRNIKQFLLLVLDMTFVSLAMWSAVALRVGHSNFQTDPIEYVCAALTIVISAIIFLRLGLYRAVIRFMGQQAIWAILKGVSYSALVLGSTIFFTQAEVPRSMPFVYWALAMCLIGGSRLVVRAYYQSKLRAMTEKVLIYGAGESGRQLLTALHHGDQYRAVVFVDDDTSLQRTIINGLQVASPDAIESLVHTHEVDQVLLAIPSASPARRREIIDSLVGLPVYVRTVPRIHELVDGSVSATTIKDIELDELLGRDPVPPRNDLLEECIAGKVVMVTGAGGSIGSELCRQLLPCRPRELILLDNSEYALYNIERELRATLADTGGGVELVALLGSVQDQRRMEKVHGTFGVQTVYHAAAYKHVPLVEYNVAEGVANNVFGTYYAAAAAERAGVETFVLVSTDKAVRPTNVMGASKRFAEMILQAMAQGSSGTRFSMVRFGNVLGSSGSVVPLFREQIRSGGPVTVTHPDVSRYFMSTKEAAQLVLQAGAMGTGGDVFVLDMGEPVKIVDLATRMIRLSGYEIHHEDQVGTEIPIDYIGLRPGEKLHEELLLGSSVSGTGHPMIMRAEEEYLPLQELQPQLEQLREHCDEIDSEGIKRVFHETVSGFAEHQDLHDHIWNRQRDSSAFRRDNVKELFPD